MSITTTIKVGETAKTITLPEGKALTIKPTAGSTGTAGVAYLLDQALGGTNSKGTWQIGSAALAPIGPYEGTQKILINCSAGSLDATVADAAPTTRQDVLQRLRSADRTGYFPTPAAAVSIATLNGDWSGANAPVAVAAGAVSAEQILPVAAMNPGDVPFGATPPSGLAAGLTVHSYRWVTSTTVGIRFRNTSGGSLTPPAGTWGLTVARWTNGVPVDVPYITMSAGGASSSVGAAGVIKTVLGDSGLIRMRHPTFRDAGYGGTFVCPSQNTPLSGTRQGSVCAAEWLTDAPKMEVSFVGNRSNLQIYVDGKCVTPAPLNLPLDFNYPYRALIDFTQGGTNTTYVRKQRKIRVEMSAFGSTAWFGGVTLLKSDSIAAPTSANPIRGVIFGDSFIEGKSPAHPIATAFTCQNDGFANRVGDLLGWDETIVCGVGGTGYLSDTVGTAKKYGDRINDIISLAPDVVVVFGSLNDGSPYTPANTQAAVTAFHAQLSAALPNALIIVMGVQKVGNASDSLASLNDAVRNGVAAVGAPNLYFVDMFSPAWVTGTGKSTSQTNDGNADWITGPDATHPTWEGYNFYTYKTADAIRIAVKTLLARL